MRLSLLLVLLITSNAAFGQDTEPAVSTAAPATELERFAASSGTVLVKSTTDIGTLAGDFSTGAELRVRTVLNATSGRTAKGLIVQVNGRNNRVADSLIDADELADLIAGVDYILALSPSVTSQEGFEATYNTRGDFVFATLRARDQLSWALSSGRVGRLSAFFPMDKMPEFRRLLIEAKARLDALP